MTTDLTEDEITLLMIAASGQAMIPIGRWKAPLDRLIANGYMRGNAHPGDPTGYFNNTITPAGRVALEEADTAAFKSLIDAGALVQKAQDELRSTAEKIAQQMSDMAVRSANVSGQPAKQELERWARAVLERALAILDRA